MQRKVYVISSFAVDRIIKHRQDPYQRNGGPALWITSTLKKMNTDFTFLGNKISAKTEIRLTSRGERGQIISLPRIKITSSRLKNDATFIISTVGNEFDLNLITKMRGLIAIDAQGYIRTNHFNTIRASVLSRISIFKMTSDEMRTVNEKIIGIMKKKTLIVTRGKNGTEIYEYGKKFYIKPKRIIYTQDTIGAGDTFLAAFIAKYLQTNRVAVSARFAQKLVENFLSRKK